MDTYYYQSPAGILEIESNGNAITGVRIVNGYTKANPVAAICPIIREACRQLEEYFAGNRKNFDLPLDLQGTDFQRKVWAQLQQIPYGTTISYAQLAKAVDNPKACRAVGSANGKNPVAIVVPCHRVIASDGSPGGYAYGLEIKNQLLLLEKNNYAHPAG